MKATEIRTTTRIVAEVDPKTKEKLQEIAEFQGFNMREALEAMIMEKHIDIERLKQ